MGIGRRLAGAGNSAQASGLLVINQMALDSARTFMSDMLAAIIGAILGAVGTYFATHRFEREQSRQQRVALASALLMELRHAEYMLRRFIEDLDNTSGELRLRVFSRLEPDLFLLEADIVYRVLDFYDRVEEVELLRKGMGGDATQARRHRLHVKIISALNAVSELHQGLAHSGGIEPPVESYNEVTGWPKLPARVFHYGPPEESHPLHDPPGAG